MPNVVFGLQFVFSGVISAVGSSAFLTFVARTAFAIGLSTITSKLFGPKSPRQDFGLTDKQVTVRGALEYRKVVYGEAMVSGPIVYTNLSGQRGQYLWYVIALCQGESESIEEVWFDGNKILASEINYTPPAGGQQSGTGDGIVSNSLYVNSETTPDTYAVNIWWALGHENQVVQTTLSNEFSDWGINHAGKGVTYLYTRLFYDVDTEEIWNEEGEPRDVKALVRGRRCFDRRHYSLTADPNFETTSKAVGGGLRWFADNTPEETEDDSGSGGTVWATNFWADEFWAADFWA